MARHRRSHGPEPRADGSVWSDHTDIRPTMLSILGLQSDYVQDGRALTELMKPAASRPRCSRT